MGSVVSLRNGADGSKMAMYISHRATLGSIALSAAMPRKGPFQRVIAWLVLIALGLTMAMPTASRVLVASPVRSAITTGEGCGAQLRDSKPRRDPPPGHGLDVCGYCSLANHSPVVMGPAMAPLLSPPATPVAVRRGDLRIPSSAFPEAHSRDPPLA